MGPDSQQWPPQQGNPGQWPPQGQQPQWQPPQWQPQQPPQQWGPPGQQPPRKRKSGAGWIFGGLCGLAVVIAIAIAASHGSSPQPSPAATGAPAGTTAPTAAAAAASTVTYVVTGSAADVTYGPEGSSISATVPLHKTVTIPASPPGYYAIDAQLNGSGSVTCEILVGGKVISKASASGSYEIASCEITQDPFSGAWQDANAA